MSSRLLDVLTLRAVQELADPRTFARGTAYFHDGAVGLLDMNEHEVRASVQGTRRYRVRVAADVDGELEFECNCPVGMEGDFCKHAVALALAWLENSGEEIFVPSEQKPAKTRKKRKTNEEQIREYLETLSESELRQWLIDATDRDRDFRDKLLFAAQAKPGGALAALKSVVRQATRVTDYVDWRHAGDYGERVADLAQLLAARIGDRDPKLVEIIEEAIASAEDALGNIDDSDGSVMPSIMELREVHERACEALKPDPVALAERLFRFQINGEWDTFHSILPEYRQALGSSGLERYRELAESAWKEFPALSPEAFRTGFDSKRFRVGHAMEALAELSNDIDALIAVKSHSLSSPHAFHTLAELLKKHRRYDDALAWAEKGIAAFKNERLDALVQFCIDEYLRRDDVNRVESLAWQRFTKQPGDEAYLELIQVAKRIKRPDELATRAMRHLWELVRSEDIPTAKRRPNWQPSMRSAIVSIHFRQQEAEKAWEAFCGGPVDIRLWDTMAAMRGKTHPEDAVALYKKLLPHEVTHGRSGAKYTEAFALVKAIRALRASQRQEALFQQELAEVQTAWKAKRNLMKLLETLR